MKTELLKIDQNNPDTDKLAYAAEVLHNGGLVAFPTETVYGIGANALDKTAVEGIYRAKGRPSDNPLIVHIADKSDVAQLVSEIPASAGLLMDAFWPGPLTLVMPKSDKVPSIITAGLETVAVRMPSHPVALALINRAGIPVAAPSANSSGKPSPTCAEHVVEDLWGKVDIIIDSGKVNVGLESTVLDLVAYPPSILRPGGVTAEQLRALLGPIEMHIENSAENKHIPRSPGMKYRHYAPKAAVTVVEGSLDKVVAEINRLSLQFRLEGKNSGILATDETIGMYTNGEAISMGSRKSPEIIAANLFHSLRHFDGCDVQIIFAEAVNGEGIGMAIMNRLKKAAGFSIIRV